jgi:hypothetical protein
MKSAFVAMMAVLGLGMSSLQAKTAEEIEPKANQEIEQLQGEQKVKEAKKKAEDIAAQLKEELEKQMASENPEEEVSQKS